MKLWPEEKLFSHLKSETSRPLFFKVIISGLVNSDRSQSQ